MNKNTVIYLSPYDILRPRTNQVSDVRFTEGFAQNDCDTHLVVPSVQRKDNIRKEEVHETYGLLASLHIHYLPTKFINDVYGKKQLLEVTWYSTRKVFSILKSRKESPRIYIISRSTHLLRPFFFLRKLFGGTFKNVSLIHWAHDFHKSAIHQAIYRKSDFLIATNSSILNELFKVSGRKSHEGAYTLNPITEFQANEKISREEARREIQFPESSTPLIAYTGKLGQHYDKEIKYILEAAALLPTYTFLFTGGKPETVTFWEDYCNGKGIHNVIFTGYIYDYQKIKLYQFAADVLLSYYTHQGHDVRYNLPNKLCEYMLTGNVIITPDYPATADLLNKNNCIFTKPENSHALADSIRFAIEHPLIAKEKAEQAMRDVKEITFKKIAARLLQQFP
jgi:glycosyltransferase involved in cell wall biosynthesis